MTVELAIMCVRMRLEVDTDSIIMFRSDTE